MPNTKTVAAIGSRNQPYSLALIMMRMSAVLASQGYRITSGGAAGADNAFEVGARIYFDHHDVPPLDVHDKLRVYLPWNGFQNRSEGMPGVVVPSKQSSWASAVEMANALHPSPKPLQGTVEKFMARNCYQVLQDNLDRPVDFVLCSTPDQCIDGNKTTRMTGGTGQALRLAAMYKVPIRNLQYEPHLRNAVTFLYQHQSVWLPIGNRLQEAAQKAATVPDTAFAEKMAQACVAGLEAQQTPGPSF